MDHQDITPKKMWDIPLVRVVIWICILTFLSWVIAELWEIFLPVFIGLVLGYLSSPFAERLQRKWNIPPALSASFLITATIVVFTALVWWLSPLISSQAQMLADKLPSYLQTFTEKTGIELNSLIPEFSDLFAQGKSLLSGETLESPRRIWGLLKNVFSGASYVLFMMLMIPIYWFLFTLHFNGIVEFFRQYVPASRRAEVERLAVKMNRAVSSFFRGRLLIALIMGAFLSVGWWLCEVPFWFVLGMTTGFLNIIPYASVVMWPVAVVLKYIDAVQSGGGDISMVAVAVWPSVIYVVVQLLEGWVLTPWIQRQETDLSIGTVLIVVFIGGALAGVLGLLLAIPIAACLKIILWDFILPKLKQWAETH